jgi:fructose-1-phosphate kinase PfkB-like protein
MMVEFIRAGLATAKAERVVAGGKTIEVTRVRITEAGRAGAGGFLGEFNERR